MEILGDTVYGTSGTLYGYDAAVKGYALETGQPVMNVPVPDVVNLSSLVADSSGNLYCSESFGSRIIKVRISDRTSSVFVYSNGLNKPNGLIFEQDRNRLVVLSDRPRPPIQSVSLATAAVTTLTTTTLAGGDGITKDEKGNYYITGYYLSGVYKFDSAFSTSPQMIYSGSGIVYPTYDARDHSLLLTLYNSNDWKRISVTTGIGSCADLPEGIILYQNHPNPFNPTTTIAWHMEHAAYVKLSIYDVLGREVVVLVNEKKEAGTHTVRWNVHQRFAGSARQASGVYFYTLRAGKFLDTKRMLLLE
jgi:hypothetical protein